MSPEPSIGGVMPDVRGMSVTNAEHSINDAATGGEPEYVIEPPDGNGPVTNTSPAPEHGITNTVTLYVNP